MEESYRFQSGLLAFGFLDFLMLTSGKEHVSFVCSKQKKQKVFVMDDCVEMEERMAVQPTLKRID